MDLSGVPHPRSAHSLVGHASAETVLAEAAVADRLHHAWLIGGPEGIGKATLAYRLARFLVATATERTGHPNDPLAVDPGGRTARQIAAGSHPNVMVLERVATGDKAAPKTIPVDAVRKALVFFGSTAADGGHRVCIVDALDDLNSHGANALLKTIEEPPPRATILIVSHAPQRVLPTVRSRCRKLLLQPLAPGAIIGIVRGFGAEFTDVDPAILSRAAASGEGSVQRTLSLVDPRRLALLDEIERLLADLPHLQIPRVLALADRLAEKGGEGDFALALDAINAFASAQIAARLEGGARRLAPLAEVCEKIAADARALEAYNLDRRSFVVTMFGTLAEAVRRAA